MLKLDYKIKGPKLRGERHLVGKASGGAVISSNVRRDVGSKGRNEKYDDAGTGRYTHTFLFISKYGCIEIWAYNCKRVAIWTYQHIDVI